jgi:hypothetical protein
LPLWSSAVASGGGAGGGRGRGRGKADRRGVAGVVGGEVDVGPHGRCPGGGRGSRDRGWPGPPFLGRRCGTGRRCRRRPGACTISSHSSNRPSCATVLVERNNPHPQSVCRNHRMAIPCPQDSGRTHSGFRVFTTLTHRRDHGRTRRQRRGGPRRLVVCEIPSLSIDICAPLGCSRFHSMSLHDRTHTHDNLVRSSRLLMVF